MRSPTCNARNRCLLGSNLLSFFGNDVCGETARVCVMARADGDPSQTSRTGRRGSDRKTSSTVAPPAAATDTAGVTEGSVNVSVSPVCPMRGVNERVAFAEEVAR